MVISDFYINIRHVVPLDASLIHEKPLGWDGYFASSPSEQRSPVELTFLSNYNTFSIENGHKKEAPQWLKGTLMRNSPALHTVGKRAVGHQWDGFAKIYSWSFDSGKVLYYIPSRLSFPS